MATQKKTNPHRQNTQQHKPTTSPSNGKKKLTAAQRKELERQQRITQALIIVGSIIVAVILIIIFLSIYGDNGSKDLTSNTSADKSGDSTVSTVPIGGMICSMTSLNCRITSPACEPQSNPKSSCVMRSTAILASSPLHR